MIRAAVSRAFGEPLSIEDVTLAAPGPGEVRVRLQASAICHSDIAYMDGLWGGDLPAVWGHEAAGIVAEVGAGVEIAAGTPVVVTLIRSCGDCRYCRRGQYVACDATFDLDQRSPLTDATGRRVTHGLRTAAFAEQVVVHHSQLVPVPEELPLDVASLLGCGVITGVGAVRNTAAVEAGSSVIVVGCGGVGVNVIQGARLAGADPIVAVDVEPRKLDTALSLGATHGLNPAEHDVVVGIAEATEGHMADYVFVAVGARTAIEAAAGYVGTAGALVIVGMPATGVMSEIDPGTLAARNQRILGSKMGTAAIQIDVPHLAGLYAEGALELDRLITARYRLDDINEAIADVKAGRALRNVIVFEDPSA